MVISSNDPDQGEYLVFLRGEVFSPPVIDVDPQLIEVDNQEQEISVRDVTITNNGDALLRWETDLEVISEPERDLARRNLRSVSSGAPIRDDVDIDGMRMAVFQTDGAWGEIYPGIMQNGQNPQITEENFVWYRNPDDLANVDFSEFNAIMFATGEQWSWARGAYEQNLARIEEYVANGGGVYYETGNFPWELRFPGPGGIINDIEIYSNNGVLIVSPDDGADNYSYMAEVFHSSQPDYWNEGEQIEGSSFLHSGFSYDMLNAALDQGMIEWYQVQAVHDQDNSTPGVVAYGYGGETALMVGHPTGHTWWNWNREGMWGSMAAEIMFYLGTAGSPNWVEWDPAEGEIASGNSQVMQVTISTIRITRG